MIQIQAELDKMNVKVTEPRSKVYMILQIHGKLIATLSY
jgi:Fe2+ or Zn2+ uptake regulation protein